MASVCHRGILCKLRYDKTKTKTKIKKAKHRRWIQEKSGRFATGDPLICGVLNVSRSVFRHFYILLLLGLFSPKRSQQPGSTVPCDTNLVLAIKCHHHWWFVEARRLQLNYQGECGWKRSLGVRYLSKDVMVNHNPMNSQLNSPLTLCERHVYVRARANQWVEFPIQGVNVSRYQGVFFLSNWDRWLFGLLIGF